MVRSRIKDAVVANARPLDLIAAPFLYPAAILMLAVRRVGVHRLTTCGHILRRVGVFPVRDHYHEPLFNPRHLRHPLDRERHLPGIDWNTDKQLSLLSQFEYAAELKALEGKRIGQSIFRFANNSFESGDADYWYSIIRLMKPRRIFEVGSGHSTLLAQLAIRENEAHDTQYRCQHVCVEPFEQPWLEELGPRIIRQRVEDVGTEMFRALEDGDILFIDSSHVIRPQGDVTFEYLQLLPELATGVIVHIHDVFSPREYPASWVVDEVRMWNEQYLLEAFLTSNPHWEVLGALNYLKHNHYEQLRSKCPWLRPDREPGSFYIRKVS